jgi:hypothetical protein
MIGRVEYDADGYAFVRVVRNGVMEQWCLTDHDYDRVRERGARRPAPIALTDPPSWRLRLAVWLLNWTRPRNP